MHERVSRMPRGLAIQRDQLVRDGEEGKLEAGGDTSLVEDIREVAFYGLFADGELLGDILIAAAFDNAGDNFEFAGCETVGLLLRGGRGLLHQLIECGDEVDDTLAADPVVA